MRLHFYLTHTAGPRSWLLDRDGEGMEISVEVMGPLVFALWCAANPDEMKEQYESAVEVFRAK